MELKEVGTCVSVDSKIDRDYIEDRLELVEKKEWVPFAGGSDEPRVYRKLENTSQSKETLISEGVDIVEELLFRVNGSIVTYGNVLNLDGFSIQKEHIVDENVFYIESRSIEDAKDIISNLSNSLDIDRNDINIEAVKYKIDIDENIRSDNFPDCLQAEVEANCNESPLVDDLHIKAPEMVVSAFVMDEEPSMSHVKHIKQNIEKAREEDSILPEVESYKKAYQDIFIDIPSIEEMEIDKGALFSQDDLIILEKSEDGRVVYFKNKNLIGAKSESSMEDLEEKIDKISMQYDFEVDGKPSTCVVSFSDLHIK